LTVDHDDIAKSFDEFARYIVSEYSLEKTLEMVVDLAVQSLAGADFAGISLRKDGHIYTAASNAPNVEEIDALQYSLGSGPCLQAMDDGEIQEIPSMLTEARWPEFTNKALYAGVLSVLSVPLKVHDECFGALNCYSVSENAFVPRDHALARTFGAQAGVVLMNARVYRAATDLSRQLQEAIESRAVIDQAKGVLMAREHLTADEAFEKLRRASQKANLKVREIAQRVVSSVTSGQPPSF
jgi:GAF domain-containing protein